MPVGRPQVRRGGRRAPESSTAAWRRETRRSPSRRSHAGLCPTSARGEGWPAAMVKLLPRSGPSTTTRVKARSELPGLPERTSCPAAAPWERGRSRRRRSRRRTWRRDQSMNPRGSLRRAGCDRRRGRRRTPWAPPSGAGARAAALAPVYAASGDWRTPEHRSDPGRQPQGSFRRPRDHCMAFGGIVRMTEDTDTWRPLRAPRGGCLGSERDDLPGAGSGLGRARWRSSSSGAWGEVDAARFAREARILSRGAAPGRGALRRARGTRRTATPTSPWSGWRARISARAWRAPGCR